MLYRITVDSLNYGYLTEAANAEKATERADDFFGNKIPYDVLGAIPFKLPRGISLEAYLKDNIRLGFIPQEE